MGAGVPYTTIMDELGGRLPGLAQASRTVGSPQIRNRGTVGGNLGSASPAGDATRRCSPPTRWSRWSLPCGAPGDPGRPSSTPGLKRSALAPDELIARVHVPAAAGPQQFSKVGTRNAMVIAVCSFALALDPPDRAVGTGIGSAAPTPLRAREAEGFLAGELDWDSRMRLPEDLARALR